MVDRKKVGRNDEPEVLEAESIEYMPRDNEPQMDTFDVEGSIPRPDPRVYVYKQNQTPCCGGCGCLAAALVFLYLFNGVPVINWILVIAATVVSARFFMNVAGIPRWSSSYSIVFIPVFVAMLSLMNHMLRGAFLFSIGQFFIISGVAMVLLYLIRGRSLSA